MVKAISFIFILANIQSASSLHVDPKPVAGASVAASAVASKLGNKADSHPLSTKRLRANAKNLTLKQWIMETKCLNVASQPLMNTQFAQLGALDALNDAGLLSKVTGFSGVSSGAFVMALAATKNFSENSKKFREIWNGWGNLVDVKGGDKMKDPLMSENYKKKILDQVLPATFEELKVPTAMVAVKYDDEDAAAKIDETRAQPMVVSDGPLAESVIVSSSAMMGKGCPKCDLGFQAKNFRGQYPVADGFLKDEYGTLGLAALKPCPNLLHFQPQNYARQLIATPNKDLDTQPENVVSLSLDVPSSAIMSMNWVGFLENVHRIRKNLRMKENPLGKNVANMDNEWEKVEYESSYEHMTQILNDVMDIDPVSDEEETHYFLALNTKPHWDNMRSMAEKLWDDAFDGKHTEYWYRTADRRNNMVRARNELLEKGKLSYRVGGNGLGAPKKTSVLQTSEESI